MALCVMERHSSIVYAGVGLWRGLHYHGQREAADPSTEERSLGAHVPGRPPRRTSFPKKRMMHDQRVCGSLQPSDKCMPLANCVAGCKTMMLT